MAYNYEDILRAQYEAKAADRAQALADLEAARMNENAPNIMDAANRIVEIDNSVRSLDNIANSYLASQRAQPQGNQHGLSDEEMDVAKNSHSAGTAERRIEEYARNKQRYQHTRASGQYRDDQGTVRR